MKTLEQLSKEYEKEITDAQLAVLRNCSEEKEGYNFIEDNFPPTFHTTYQNPVTGDPAKPYSETAPNWKPSLSKLANYILKNITIFKKNLPLLKDKPLRKSVFVLDKNGIIDVELYISDQGINCIYGRYSIVDTLIPFVGKNVKLEDIEPFYVFRDKY